MNSIRAGSSILDSLVQKAPALLAMACFCVASLASMIATKSAWIRFFSNSPAKFDGDLYFQIAMHGYEPAFGEVANQGLPAFYPMWPLFLRFAWWMTGTTGSTFVASLISIALFLGSLVPLAIFLRKQFSSAVVIATLLLFALNPNSVFHATLYSESWFCLVAALFLLSIQRAINTRSLTNMFGLIAVSALLSFSRPVLLQLTFACTVALLVIPNRKAHLNIGLCIIAGIALGYAPYGLYNLDKFGSFFHPFKLQSLWGRELGLHWDVVFRPKTVSGSWTVLFWDLIAFYGPALMCYFAIRSSSERAKESFIFWLCNAFAFAHSAIAFLTYDRFMSLGRHNFGTPFIFVAFAYLLPESSKLSRPLRIAIFISTAFVFNFWARFGRGAWIG